MKEVYPTYYHLVDTMGRTRKTIFLGVFSSKTAIAPPTKKSIVKKHPDHTVVFEAMPSIQPFHNVK